jgi:hypothetical protein
VQLQRLVTLYTSVNKAILNLEDYVKHDLHSSKTSEKGRVYKNDSDVTPKHEPGIGKYCLMFEEPGQFSML